jgi:glycosyltransferase involved in cell wall biosynthesis
MSSPPYKQVLPSLPLYREQFTAAGVTLPLPHVPGRSQGLLAALPPPLAGRQGWPWTSEHRPVVSYARELPLITLVTPSFQQAAFVEETIRSVLLQNYPNLEYVVLDGGSTDGSCEIIERYRPWLSFARSQRDNGQSHAINQGFSIGSGEIFGWLNSDDLLLPGTLHAVATAYLKGAEIVCGDALEYDQHSHTFRELNAGPARARYAKFSGLLIQPATFWAARIHQPIWEEQHCAMDYELWLRLLPGRRVEHLRRPLAVARKHEAAKTHSKTGAYRWQDDAQRNAFAHPGVYASTWANRWLDFEYKLVQRLDRAWFSRARSRAADAATACCGWENCRVRT